MNSVQESPFSAQSPYDVNLCETTSSVKEYDPLQTCQDSSMLGCMTSTRGLTKFSLGSQITYIYEVDMKAKGLLLLIAYIIPIHFIC